MLAGLTNAIVWAASAVDNQRVPWKELVIGGITADFVFQTFLDFRQYRVQCRESPPAAVKGEAFADEASFRKGQQYSRAKLVFGVVDRVISFSLQLFLYKVDALPKVWRYFMSTTPRYIGGGEKTAGTLMMISLAAVGIVLDLPAKLYYTFVLEEKFGFNKQTLKLWTVDQLKQWALGLVFIPPLIAAMQGILMYFEYQFVTYMLAFVLAINIAAMIIYPAIIQPLFNKFEPLEDGELRTAIENLARSEGFPLTRLYVVDGSTRSAHSNAYFMGLPWNKQIVLFDTLIKDSSTSEIVAVLAHELGHWKRNHLLLQFAFVMSTQFVNFFLLGLFLKNTSFYESLGFAKNEMPVIVALMVYMDVLSPVQAFLTFAQNYLVRSCEYDADAFATRSGHGVELSRALVGLNRSNLGVLDADWLYSTFHYSHPILHERLTAITLLMRKQN